MNEQMMQLLIKQFGGPQQFQQFYNSVQQQLQQTQMTPEQFVKQKLQNGSISQETYNQSYQRAQQFMQMFNGMR